MRATVITPAIQHASANGGGKAALIRLGFTPILAMSTSPRQGNDEAGGSFPFSKPLPQTSRLYLSAPDGWVGCSRPEKDELNETVSQPITLIQKEEEGL